MDRPEAHRPIGARRQEPGSAGAPLAAVTPIRRSRDIGAPRPRRLSEQPAGGARHRIEGGPTTPAGIPVISAADSYVTDRLPVVGGKFDPGARQGDSDRNGQADPGPDGWDPASPDIAFSIGDNGPDTDQLPVIAAPPGWKDASRSARGAANAQPAADHRTPGSAPAFHSADTFPPRPALELPGANMLNLSGADTFPAHHALDLSGADTFPPRPAPAPLDADTFPPRPTSAPQGADTFPPRAADGLGAGAAPSRPSANGNEPSRPAPDYNGDDAVFARMIDRSKRRRVPRWVGPLAASVAGAVLLGGTYLQLREPSPTSTSTSTPLVPTSAGPVTAACPTEQIGTMVRGKGEGGTDSGIAAILAFQHAYYVARSGDQARTLVAAEAVAPSAAAIQAGIDSTPVGTTHCVEITPGAFAGQYLVKVTAFRPDAAPSTYTPQLVGTAEVGGKTLISSFGSAPR
ncbi:hypothetical protein [Nocardia sp. NPDC058666]|uniref:hypothetical protein n=1 Tax=unclassified Nocardia TaxID=2637762 RepID=UPI003653AD19